VIDEHGDTRASRQQRISRPTEARGKRGHVHDHHATYPHCPEHPLLSPIVVDMPMSVCDTSGNVGGAGAGATRAGFVPALLLGCQASIYLCVPETDQVKPLAGALATALLVELASRRHLPWQLYAILTGFVLWSGLYGATGRDSATIGAWFSMWPLVLVVLTPTHRYWAAAVGIVAAAIVARTGALQPTAGPALIAVAIALPASIVVAQAGRLLGRQAGRRALPSHPPDDMTGQ